MFGPDDDNAVLTTGEARSVPAGWDVPEVCAVAVLVVTALLSIAGLAAGVIAATVTTPGQNAPGGITTGAALERGGQWAGPVLAIALLGVLLLCWWRAHGWTGRLASATGTNHRTLLVAHVRRTAALARYTLAALVLTFAGALTGLIGLVLTLREISNQTAVTWPSYLSSAAAAAGVLVALLAGLFAATRLRQSVWSAYELVALGEPDTAPTSDDSDP